MSRLVRQNENVSVAVAASSALKKVIAAIGCPHSAALVRRSMPGGQQWMKIRTVSSDLPQGSSVGNIVRNRKSNSVVIRRENGTDWFTLHSGDTSGLTSIGTCDPDTRAFLKYESSPVWRPPRGVRLEAIRRYPQSARRASR